MTAPEGSTKSGRTVKLIAGVLAAIVVVYGVLLIPEQGPPPLQSETKTGERQAFAWNQDDYWKSLEATHRRLKQGGCATAVPALASKVQSAKGLLRTIETTALGPDAPMFRRLEGLVFEMGPVISACNVKVNDYTSLIADIRSVIKKQSADWDMNCAAARTTIYRLLYGSRAAVEEVILQLPAGVVPLLTPGQDEPSATPWADVRNVRIHSGDILVSRGGAPTSALIARGNDYPGNFSHIAFVYVDPATREAHIVEAHIEKGVTVSTVEQYLNDKKLRVMLLRLRADLPQLVKDPLIPHEAAEQAYLRATKEHIPYDFEMNYRDHSKLFCSEVASAEYEQFNVNLWMGISHLSSPGLQRWLNAFGVRYFQTQEPSDLEYDPQLTVVAEWRDPETLKKDHYDNAVTEVMLDGAEKGDGLGYQWYLLPVVRAAKAYSVALNLFGKVGPVPEGMSSTAALRNIWYSKKHDAIVARLGVKAKQSRREQGYEPPYWKLVSLARLAKSEIENENPKWKKQDM